MTGLARALVCLFVLATAAGCAAAIDPGVIADAQTAVRVKTALVNDPDLGARTIEVRVAGGVVELSGRVLTPAEVERAIALARAVPGVADVRSTMQVGAAAVVPIDEQSRGGGDLQPDAPELQDNPGLLAVGAAIGWSNPDVAAFKTRVSISPLFRLGSGRGLGVAFGLSWFQADVQSLAGSDVLTRVKVKPVMVGASYTVASDRASLSGSVVGGYAWNSLTVTDTGTAAGLPVEVGNSLAWRPGVSFWYDVTRRIALNVTAGHVITRLKLTVLDDGRIEKRSTRGDTTIVHAGLAYKLF